MSHVMAYRKGIVKWSAVSRDTEGELHKPSSLTFVTAREPTDFLSSKNKKVVQRHAVREGKRRQKTSQERWVSGQHRRHVLMEPAPRDDLPQEQCPIAPLPYMSDLVKYLRTFLLPEIHSTSTMRTLYTSTAMQSPGIFHAVLYAASAHQEARLGLAPRSTTLYHETMSLAHLRERVQAAEPRDYLEILVSSITHRNFAELAGRDDVCIMHERAVEYMLSQWDTSGGLLDKDVFRKMMRIGDLRRAVGQAVTPTWMTQPRDFDGAIDSLTRKLMSDMDVLNARARLNCATDQMEVIRVLIRISVILRRYHTGVFAPADVLYLTAIRSFVSSMTELYDILPQAPANNASDSTSTTFSLAAAVFCRSLQQSTPFCSAVHDDLLNAIDAPAMKMFEEGTWKTDPELYLWVSMVVKAASGTRKRSSDFKPFLGVIMLIMGVDGNRYEEMEKLISSFLWLEVFLSAASNSVWEPVRPDYQSKATGTVLCGEIPHEDTGDF